MSVKSKMKYLKWILFFAITFSTTQMNAQENITNNQGLNAQQQSLVIISALTASGNVAQLKVQLSNGLDSGLSISEIKEALVQLYAYCGFPRSLNALGVFQKVLEERKATGINDKEGKQIMVENNVADKYEQGRKVLEVLTKTPQSKPAPGFGEFAPRIDAFLKEHLFADVFSSDVLSFQQRELVTITALATMTGLESQAQFHIGVGKNTGITETQLTELAQLIETYINKTQADTVRKFIGASIH
jgi:4-carboxymuconolactone decarboxylase